MGTRSTTTNLSSDQLRRLLDATARDGIAAHEAALGPIATAARAGALSPVLVDVLLDTHAPVVARERALGRLVRGLLDRARHPLRARTVEAA